MAFTSMDVLGEFNDEEYETNDVSPEMKQSTKSTEKVDGCFPTHHVWYFDDYYRSQHPWYRRLQKSMIKGELKIAYLVGTILVFNGEDNFPAALTRDLERWMKVDAKPGEEITAEIATKQVRRRAVMDAARSFAAELGFGHIKYPAQAGSKISMSLHLIKRNRAGVAPGDRRDLVYQKQAEPSFDLLASPVSKSLPASPITKTLEKGSKRRSLEPHTPKKAAKRSRMINADDFNDSEEFRRESHAATTCIPGEIAPLMENPTVSKR